MNSFKQFLKRWQSLILIFIVSVAAYGLLIPWLSYYMDDWGHAFLYETYGLDAFTRYFEANRPLWGVLFRIDMSFLQNNVLLFHLYGLFWRIITSFSFFWLVSLIWPARKNFSLVAALLFAVYPGFVIQPIAFTISHLWIIYTVFLVSNCFTILAIKYPNKRWLFSLVAIALSLFNILCMEYFLPLEVVRLFIFFYLFTDVKPFWARVWKAARYWLPYLVCLLGVTIYRAFFYQDQTHIYSLGLVDQFKIGITNGLSALIQQVGSAFYQSLIEAWIQPFTTLASHAGLSVTFLGVLSLVAIIVLGLAVFFIRQSSTEKQRMDWSPLVIGFLALIPAGVPFYVTALIVKVEGANSRFTLPFMFGGVLIFAFLLEQIPQRTLRAIATSIFIAAAIGFHLFNANSLRLMSEKYNEIMYQISWRTPGLTPGALIITNEQSDSLIYTHSTMRSMFNLIYPKDDPKIEYDLIFGRDLAERLSRNEQSVADTLTTDLQNAGRSSDIVIFQMTPPGCVRFIEADTPFIANEINKYGYERLSEAQNLVATGVDDVQLNLKYAGDEPAHGWCYFFEKADLALQLKDYASIQKYYQTVTESSFRPKLDYEWFPFIEGLAAAGDWQSVLEISANIIQNHPENTSYQAFICQKLAIAISEQQTSQQSTDVMSQLGCQ